MRVCIIISLVICLSRFIPRALTVWSIENEALQESYRMPNISYFCPQRYFRLKSELNNPSTICRFCPFIYCYIARGIDMDSHEVKNYMNCSRRRDMPLERDILQHLDCAMTGLGKDSTRRFNLSIYVPPLVSIKYVANCIRPDFLDWLPTSVTIENIEFGFPLRNLPRYMYLIHNEILKYSHHQVFQRSHLTETVQRSDLTRRFLHPSTTLILTDKLDPQLSPEELSANLSNCRLKSVTTMWTNEACKTSFLQQNRFTWPWLRGQKICNVESFSKFHNHKAIMMRLSADLHEKEMSSIYTRFFMFFAMLTLMTIMIGAAILAYYIRHHSGWGQTCLGAAKSLHRKLGTKSLLRSICSEE